MNPDDRPNILVIMTDQQSANALSCAGNADVHTSAIDSLAQAGARFTHAYCTSPLCVPSRASMVTSRLPSQLDVDDNVATVPGSFPHSSMGRVFANAGYECAYAGKWHIPGIVHEGQEQSSTTLPTSGFSQIHASAHDGLADACGRFFMSRQADDAPFLLVASFNEPHGICEWARSQSPPSGEIDDVDWRQLPLLPPNFRPGTEEPEALRLIQRFAWTVHPTQNWDEERWRRYRYAYFRLCERVDAEIATLLAALDRSGTRNNTVVVFTSDHGDMQGAHGWNQKKVLYEESAAVPFIVASPAPAEPGVVRDELVSSGLDLLPTLCDYAGIDADPAWMGRSVRDLVETTPGPEKRWREEVVAESEWVFPGLLPPPTPAQLMARMVRTDRYVYMCHSWGLHREQLFDMYDDPGQMINLASSGAHQGVLDDHRRRLVGHCSTAGDGFARHVPGSGVPPR